MHCSDFLSVLIWPWYECMWQMAWFGLSYLHLCGFSLYDPILSSVLFFFWNLESSVLPKNDPLLDTIVSESTSHIQTHLILNITIVRCFSHPSSTHTPSALSWRRAAWHMTTMRIIVRQEIRILFAVFDFRCYGTNACLSCVHGSKFFEKVWQLIWEISSIW